MSIHPYKLVGGVSLAALAGFVAFSCSQHRPAEPPTPPPDETWLTAKQAQEAHIATDTVSEHEVETTIIAAGRVSFDDLHVAHVFSPVTGRIRSINAELGERVKKGQTLAIIDSPDVGIAVADLEKAEADAVAAKHNFDRQTELAQMHAVSEREFEAAADDFHRADAELDRAKQKTRILRLGAVSASQAFALNSPIDGEVIDRNLNPGIEVQGEYSGSGPAVELFTVGELNPVWVLADIYEMDVGRVHVGAPVTVNVIAYPDRKFEGTINWASSALDPATRTIRVRCTLKNADRVLKPGMYATVSVHSDGRKALAMPRNGVLHIGGQTIAFVTEPNRPDGTLRFARRPIAVDEDVPGDFVPVESGLGAGESVVSSGALLLTGQ